MLSQLTPILGYDLIGRIGDDLVIEPPSGEWRTDRGTGGKGDVVPLPRIRLTELDLPLRVITECRVCLVSGSRIDLAMR